MEPTPNKKAMRERGLRLFKMIRDQDSMVRGIQKELPLPLRNIAPAKYLITNPSLARIKYDLTPKTIVPTEIRPLKAR